MTSDEIADLVRWLRCEGKICHDIADAIEQLVRDKAELRRVLHEVQLAPTMAETLTAKLTAADPDYTAVFAELREKIVEECIRAINDQGIPASIEQLEDDVNILRALK